MLSILICALIGMIIGLCIKNRSPYSDFARKGWQGFFIGVFMGVAIAFAGGMFQLVETVDTSTSSLGALNDGTSLEGHFYLGSGYIDEKQVYTYYKKVSDNPEQFKLSRLDAEGGIYDVVVQQETTDTPYVETIGNQYTSRANKLWFFPLSSYELKHVIFHVPKGSITNKVNLDAQ